MKVYARLACVSRESSLAAAVYEVDYILLTGDKRSDRAQLAAGSYSNEGTLLYNLRQSLKAHLNAKYAPSTFNSSDIVIFG